jgi:hypothetical protein
VCGLRAPGGVQVLRYRVQFDPEKEAKREERREMGEMTADKAEYYSYYKRGRQGMVRARSA